VRFRGKNLISFSKGLSLVKTDRGKCADKGSLPSDGGKKGELVTKRGTKRGESGSRKVCRFQRK